MIVTYLALARSINYDRKVRCKLKRTFTIVNYDPKPFIVQASGLTLKYRTRMKRLAEDKHSSLLARSISDEVKSFETMMLCLLLLKF
jgi:hypothetical protein